MKRFVGKIAYKVVFTKIFTGTIFHNINTPLKTLNNVHYLFTSVAAKCKQFSISSFIGAATFFDNDETDVNFQSLMIFLKLGNKIMKIKDLVVMG